MNCFENQTPGNGFTRAAMVVNMIVIEMKVRSAGAIGVGRTAAPANLEHCQASNAAGIVQDPRYLVGRILMRPEKNSRCLQPVVGAGDSEIKASV